MVTSFNVVVDFAGRQQSKTVNPVSALCITRPASLVNCFQQSGEFKPMLLLGRGISRVMRKIFRYIRYGLTKSRLSQILVTIRTFVLEVKTEKRKTTQTLE
jgi:hypothetical protein